jgi:MFS family permease
MIISCTGIFGILVSFVLIDRVGRRPLLIYGGAALVACNFIIGGLGSTSDKLSAGAGIGLISICAVCEYPVESHSAIR